MALEVDYLPVATGAGANVASQADFAGSGWQQDGFTAGVAEPDEANKIWRQSSMVAACVANFISQVLNINVLDDGDINTLITNFTDAVEAVASGAGSPKVVAVAYSANINFDCSKGNSLLPSFEVTLTGNTTLAVSNAVAGQLVVMTFIQDATGGRIVTFPANVDGPGAPDATANAICSQMFRVASNGNLYAIGPMMTA